MTKQIKGQDMTEEQDEAKIDAWIEILQISVSKLHLYGVKVDSFNFFIERREMIKTLRELCEEYGDNDWPDNLHLSDIIEKHLINPLLEEEK